MYMPAISIEIDHLTDEEVQRLVDQITSTGLYFSDTKGTFGERRTYIDLNVSGALDFCGMPYSLLTTPELIPQVLLILMVDPTIDLLKLGLVRSHK